MSKLITAIYEDGIFKPLQGIDLQDHQRVKLQIIPESDDMSLIESQKKALLEIAGIGNSGLMDVSGKHDKYLYQENS